MLENDLSRLPAPKNLTFDTKMGTIEAIEKKLEKPPTCLAAIFMPNYPLITIIKG